MNMTRDGLLILSDAVRMRKAYCSSSERASVSEDGAV